MCWCVQVGIGSPGAEVIGTVYPTWVLRIKLSPYSNHFIDLSLLNSLFLLGQHCLDPDAYILDVYHINPHAEWVIKP